MSSGPTTDSDISRYVLSYRTSVDAFSCGTIGRSRLFNLATSQIDRPIRDRAHTTQNPQGLSRLFA